MADLRTPLSVNGLLQGSVEVKWQPVDSLRHQEQNPSAEADVYWVHMIWTMTLCFNIGL